MLPVVGSLTVVLQLVILACCVAIVLHWFIRFPHPSALVAPFLPPEKRWPRAQLWKWVEEGSPDPGFIRFFMRDPERVPPPGRCLVSPVDGTVLANAERNGRHFLVISLNVWDVHVARSPCEARVQAIRDGGDMLEPSRDDPLRDEPFYFLREKRAPKQRYLELSTLYGDVTLRLITSYFSRRIEYFCKAGEYVHRGQRIGRMLFGSTCVLEAEFDGGFTLEIGQRVIAGETPISSEPTVE
jgi:phosphatidylserine decarboxylase